MKKEGAVMGMKKLLFLVVLLVPSYSVLAQTGQITGTVTDSTTGETLPGVNVVIVGTTQGAATDAQGTYTIPGLEPGTYTVQASFIGYATAAQQDVEVQAGQPTQVDFALAPQEIGLEEVVVVGYGEQEREDLTGAVASVEGDDISAIPTPSVAQALQGKVAGVQITPQSGEPGAGTSIRIRGVGTLNNASPLFVVDGMLTDDISFLNPNSIASVDVLKDASATAIYGSRGANGVIIITTKQGDFNQETRFGFNAYYGWQEVMHRIDLVSAQQYAMLANELAANTALEGPIFENPQSVGPGTDWQDVVYRTAPIQSYQLSATGGTDRITYYFGGNYIREEGVLRKSNFERASLRINNDYRLTDAITLGHNLAFTYSTGVNAPDVVRGAYHADPTLPPRTEGEFTNLSVRSSVGNPAATIFYERNEYSENRLVGNLFVDAEFLDVFTFRSSFGLDVWRRESRDFSPSFFVSPTQQNEESNLRVETEEESSWLWENTLTFEQTFGDHRFETVGGVTAQHFRHEELGGSRTNIIGGGENLWYLNAGDVRGQTNFNEAFDWSMLSFLFRTNYSYLGRYLLTVTFRADGSSRFSETNRFGYFPSFAAGWRISEEPFLQDVSWLSHLKLRASWGKIGNDKIGAYPGIPTVSPNLNAVLGGTLQFGASLVELANPDVQWETTRQTDIGLEIGLFDNRLFAQVDYYNRVTDGILVQVPIPDYVGVNTEPFVNAAEVVNRGFDFSLTWEDARGAFDYSVGLVASTVHNEVQALGQGRAEIFGGCIFAICPVTRTAPGLPIGAFYGYKVAGIWQTEDQIAQNPSMAGVVPGDLRFVDLSGPEGKPDGVITSLDRTYIGSPIADFTYGINLSFAYKGFDLSASFNGQTGNEIFNGKKAIRFGIDNFQASYLDRWHGPGTSTTEPRITNQGHNYLPSEYLLEDGSYFKLRNVQLGYTLPGSLLGVMNMQQVRIYVNGTNLFTATDYTGYTPEIAGDTVIAYGIDRGVYPIARSITVGLNMTF